MKLYYYLLYKVFRLRMVTEVKALGSRATRRATDTAGLMLIPSLGWSVYGLFTVIHLLTNAGIIYDRMSHKFWFLVVIGAEWMAVYWTNYRLLKSPCWNLYRSEFAGYSSAKRLLGSFGALLLLILFSAIPFYLIQHSDFH